MNENKAFTLIEFLIVVGILAGISTAIALNLVNIRSERNLELDVRKLVATLHETKNRSVTQQDSNQWGVHFENSTSSVDFYQVFYGASYASGTVVSRTNLNSGVSFLEPAEGMTEDVIFAKITGLPDAPKSVTIEATSGSASTTISINAQGVVSY